MTEPLKNLAWTRKVLNGFQHCTLVATTLSTKRVEQLWANLSLNRLATRLDLKAKLVVDTETGMSDNIYLNHHNLARAAGHIIRATLSKICRYNDG